MPDRDAQGRFLPGNQAAAKENRDPEKTSRGIAKGNIERTDVRIEGKRKRSELLEAVIEDTVTRDDLAAILRQMIADCKEPGNWRARQQFFDRIIGKPTVEPGGEAPAQTKLLVLMERIVQIERGGDDAIEGEWSVTKPGD